MDNSFTTYTVTSLILMSVWLKLNLISLTFEPEFLFKLFPFSSVENFAGLNVHLSNGGEMHITFKLGNSIPPHAFNFFE